MPRFITLLTVLAAAGLAAATLSEPVGAYPLTYDKSTYLTFNQPVQIPWATLSAGTYRFRLANPDTGRNVIQVLSEDSAIVYSMFHTIPDSRMRVTEESTVTFRETPAGVPPAVRTLFYGGEYRGYEFVYPKGEPILAPTTVQPEITYTRTPTAISEAPAIAEGAAPPSASVIPDQTLSLQAASSAVPAAENAPPAPELPRTASPLPLVALFGVISLGVGVGSRVVRRHRG